MGGLVMLRRIVPIAVLTFASGCEWGTPGVTWRADSSGFLYVDNKGTRVVAFDLKTKTSRPVVTDAEVKTSLPGLSPDGKQVAVARLEYPWKGKPRLQVRIYSSEGKQEKRSVWFDRNDAPDKLDKVGPVSLAWPSRDRVVLLAAERWCIYDVRQDRLIDVENTLPGFPGTSVLRPDGKGCLACRVSGEDLELLFLDWAGAVRPLGRLTSTKWEKVEFFLAEWHNDVALVMHDEVIYEADTANGTLRASKRKPPVLNGEGQLLAYHVFPGRSKVVCIYSREEGKGRDKRTRRSVEVQDLTSATRTVLIKDCNVYALLYPSPDHKTVVVGHRPYEVKKEPGLLVVGSDGKVISDIKVGP
jgi:hypothetical protein